MDEHDYELLQVLKETGNITHTAEKLYVTQSSISKRLRLLENELGVSLMVRSRHGVTFTAEGDIVLRHILNIQKELEAMHTDLDRQQGAVAGPLRLGISTNYAMFRLADRLAAYQAKYPLVTANITAQNSQSVYNMLLSGNVDIGILRGEHEDWRGERVLLEREPICLVTSHNNASRLLKDFPQITWKANSDFVREVVQWKRENNLLSAPSTIRAENTLTCLIMVSRGMGWSIVPSICLKDFDGESQPLFFANGEPLERSTYLMYTRQAAQLPQVSAFIECMHNYLRERDAANSPIVKTAAT